MLKAGAASGGLGVSRVAESGVFMGENSGVAPSLKPFSGVVGGDGTGDSSGNTGAAVRRWRVLQPQPGERNEHNTPQQLQRTTHSAKVPTARAANVGVSGSDIGLGERELERRSVVSPRVWAVKVGDECEIAAGDMGMTGLDGSW